VSDDRQKSDFKRELANLIDRFQRAQQPTAPLAFLGATQSDPHEHDTRAEFLDFLLKNLGWPRGGAYAKVIEEARVKKDDRYWPKAASATIAGEACPGIRLQQHRG